MCAPVRLVRLADLVVQFNPHPHEPPAITDGYV